MMLFFVYYPPLEGFRKILSIKKHFTKKQPPLGDSLTFDTPFAHIFIPV